MKNIELLEAELPACVSTTLCRKFVPEMGNSTAIVKWSRPINIPKPT